MNNETSGTASFVCAGPDALSKERKTKKKGKEVSFHENSAADNHSVTHDLQSSIFLRTQRLSPDHLEKSPSLIFSPKRIHGLHAKFS